MSAKNLAEFHFSIEYRLDLAPPPRILARPQQDDIRFFRLGNSNLNLHECHDGILGPGGRSKV